MKDQRRQKGENNDPTESQRDQEGRRERPETSRRRHGVLRRTQASPKTTPTPCEVSSPLPGHPKDFQDGTRELRCLHDAFRSVSKRLGLTAFVRALMGSYGEAPTVSFFNVCKYAALALPHHKAFIYEMTCKLHQRRSFLVARVLKTACFGSGSYAPDNDEMLEQCH